MSASAAAPIIAASLICLTSIVAMIVNSRLSKSALNAQERTTAATLKHQRDLSADERLWQRRADVYVDLLAWIVQAVGNPAEGTDTPHGRIIDRPSLTLQAQADVFASSEVLSHLLAIVLGLPLYKSPPGDHDIATPKELSRETMHTIYQMQQTVRAEVLGHAAFSK